MLPEPAGKPAEPVVEAAAAADPDDPLTALRREYSNSVFYADDAFAGLHLMDDLTSTNGARAAPYTVH